mmetsp:Transcript_4735/g.8875  ORF Transcript_4735/g.8875 Transcript_4735/m.8875 type:complete len:83 (+) Transcript_4735:210-458(+)
MTCHADRRSLAITFSVAEPYIWERLRRALACIKDVRVTRRTVSDWKLMLASLLLRVSLPTLWIFEIKAGLQFTLSIKQSNFQ